jgi:[ribosomal protein S18]-alanine N-acetyltransferase
MKLVLRYMRPPDIPQVVAIDRQAFETPWPARSYAYEISESSYSYMVVLEGTYEQPPTGWRRFVHAFHRNGSSGISQRQVIGYGGLWRIMDEAHISTIATHLDWRGQGYGELLLLAMIQRAVMLNAGYIVLEVRVSNQIAQNLYHKYDFAVVATRPRYYRDNGEDAYDMRLDLDNREQLARLARSYQFLKNRFGIEDYYSTLPPPRGKR